MEVGQPARVVLTPVPERPWRSTSDLEADGTAPEDVRLVERVRREEQNREGRERGRHKAPREPSARPPARIREPERGDEQGRELRPARQRGEDPTRRRPRDEPEAPD